VKRVLRALGWALLALLLLIAAAAIWITWASLPEHDGTQTVTGLTAPVTIDRDAQGVPTLQAQTEADALFALGYAHAQDRLWQMDFNRRVAQGRVAEILGPRAVELDRMFRTLGIYRQAEAMAEALEPEFRALGEAYAAGVNAGLVARRGLLPPEFWLTRAPEPAPWRVADSIAWVLMMGWDLSAHSMRLELNRLRLASRLSTDEIDEFRPPAPGSVPPSRADYAQLYRALGLFKNTVVGAAPPTAAVPVAGFGQGEGLGSNNWVVAGSRTRSGAPLLANDPHLGLTLPSVWYFARLRAPGLEVTGVTLPGVPYVMLGRTPGVAWGFTNTGPDVQDVYLERINPADPSEYATPEGYAKFDVREEVIAVRGAAPLRLAVRSTRHGPVISGALAEADRALAPNERYVLALRWTALQPGDRSMHAVRAMNRATDAAQFVAAVRDWQIAQQSMVFADRAGRIGLAAPGRVPRRTPDNDFHGMAPVPGWEARYDWDGWLPFEALPQQLDPADGLLATANNQIVPPGAAPFLTADWLDAYRVERVRELLRAQPQHDVASFQRMQADMVSLAAREMLAALRALEPAPSSAAARLVQQRLFAWDGAMRADAPEPLLYHAWLARLRGLIFDDDLGDLAPDFVARSDVQRATLAALRGQTRTRDWCDKARSPRFETCRELAEEALERTVVELGAGGVDLLALRWGDVHQARFEHRPLSALPLLGEVFDRRLPVPGDTYTINVGALRLRGPTPFATSHGATLRAIYDLAGEGGVWIYGGGQSGHPAARLYDDLLARWQQVDYLPLVPAAGTPSVARLELRPGADAPAVLR
jgi:penicillin amidase